jgi:PAS domain S-box-containing protein
MGLEQPQRFIVRARGAPSSPAAPMLSKAHVLNPIRWIAVALLLVCAASETRGQSHHGKNVLAFYSYGRENPTNMLYEQGLLRTLKANPQESPEYYSEYLEVDRFPAKDQARLLRNYLRQKYAHHRVDVIVATAETPVEFLLKDRTLFAGVPIIYTAFDPVDVAPEGSVPGVGGVFVVGVYRRTLEAIRTIHPDTREVFVITSLPDHGGKTQEDIIRRELAPFERDLTIHYLTDQTTEALIERVSQAPPRSIVLYVRHAEESASSPIDPVQAASLLVRGSAVPVYSIARTYLGQGIVGGYLVDHEAIGAQAGQLALDVLSGARPEDLHATAATLTPMFDWRALKRWGIDPARLPSRSDIWFRMPTAWDQYRGYIVGAMTLLVLQGTMIAALVVQRSRRRKVEARNTAILSAAPDMMFLLSKEGVFIDHHAADASQLPANPELFLGRHVSHVLPPNVAAAVTEALARLPDEPSPIVIEYPLSMPDGERHYEARVVPCRGNEVLAVVRDVTERKRSQQTLNEAQANLSRLARLTALGEFAATLSHEIRQPLTGILMNAKTCLRWLTGSTPNMSEVRAALSDIVEAGQRADEIIVRNRELFRHRTVEKTALDLNTVIHRVEALARSRLQAGHITLMTSVRPDVPLVHGDRVELEQVLLNLIGNSIEALEAVDSDRRLIEVSSSLSADGSVKVSVRDTGVGLEGVDTDRMFALSYTTKASGSGVGLAISRSIVEAHGGQLWAEPCTGRGATFSFTLPIDSIVAAT